MARSLTVAMKDNGARQFVVVPTKREFALLTDFPSIVLL